MAGKCKKLGNMATKAERYEAHRAKMEMKQALNGDREPTREFVMANLSQHHEHYGDTPQEHARRKAGENNS